jgi:two-component system cell cycle response regulator
MNQEKVSISLVERKKFDNQKAHAVAPNIWWVGHLDKAANRSHNPYLLIDGQEAILINPGSRAQESHKIIKNKISSLINPKLIQHIVLLHNDPTRCAATPLFERIADANVRVYAPSRSVDSIRHYGCKHPVIGLDGGDSIILKSGKSLTYYETPNLECAGSGFLHDEQSGTIFSGHLFCFPGDEGNLYTSSENWEGITILPVEGICSKKAFHQALNKIERLSPERICPHQGPILEEDIDKYIAFAREMEFNN